MDWLSPFGRKLAFQASGARDRRGLRRALLFFEARQLLIAISTQGRFMAGSRIGLRFRRETTRLPCLVRERKSEAMVRPYKGRHIPAIVVAFKPPSGASTDKTASMIVPSAFGLSDRAGHTGSRPAEPAVRIKARSARLDARRSCRRTRFPPLTARTTLPRDQLIRRRAEGPHADVLGAPYLQQSMTCPAKCLLTLPTRKRLGWWS